MKITSLNINQLLKQESWQDLKIDKSLVMNECLPYLIEFLKQSLKSEEDIVFLNEFPYYSNKVIYNTLLQLFKNNDLEIHKSFQLKRKRPMFITCAITLKKSSWHINLSHPLQLSSYISYRYGKRISKALYYNRCLEMTNEDICILGVHIPAASYRPDASVLWDDVLEYCKPLISEKLLVIGDMNVDNEGTIQKRKFNELIKLGLMDGISKNKNILTYKNISRVDYALMNSHLLSKVKDIHIDENYQQSFTDHSAIVVEI